MDRLPLELVAAVVDEASAPTLRAIRGLNKAWHKIATPKAFRRIDVRGRWPSIRGLSEILGRQDIARHVREIVYRDKYAGPNGELLPRNHDHDPPTRPLSTSEKRLLEAMCQAFGHITQAPHLSTLKLVFSPHYPRYEGCLEFRSRFVILDTVALVSPQIPLQSLTMINLLPGFSYFYLEPHILSLFPRLAHLQITMMSEIYDLFRREYTEDVDELTTFWENVMVKNVLPAVNASLTLTSLVLHNKSSPRVFPAVAFDAPTFPRLTLLSLGRIVFCKNTGAEEFIVRHKSTLTELELYQCMVGIDEEGVSSRFWSHIWDRFAKELTKLTVLIVHEDSSAAAASETEDVDSRRPMRYVSSDSMGFKGRHEALPGEEGDDDALADLKHSIIERIPSRLCVDSQSSAYIWERGLLDI